VFDAVGCEHCGNTGYKGRVSILEVLKITKELDELIAKKTILSDIYKAAIIDGYKTLADDGLRRVALGETTIEEVSRVVDLTERLR